MSRVWNTIGGTVVCVWLFLISQVPVFQQEILAGMLGLQCTHSNMTFQMSYMLLLYPLGGFFVVVIIYLLVLEKTIAVSHSVTVAPMENNRVISK